MMKKKINSLCVLLSLALISNCQGLDNKKIEMTSIEKMTIQVVDFSIMTVINVNCDKFEEFFPGEFQFADTSDSIFINRLIKIINLLEPIDSNYSNYVDTRAKIKLYSKSASYEICVGRLSCSINNTNELFITSDLLREFIENYPY